MGILILLIIAGVVLDILFISTEYKSRIKLATVLKGLASFMFVLLGIYLYANNPGDGRLLIILGLIFGMIGDILLSLRNLYEGDKSNRTFAAGILSFLIGHFLYMAYLYRSILHTGKGHVFIPVAIAIAIVIASVTIPPFNKRVTPPSKGFRKFGIIYIFVVIAMFSASLSRAVVLVSSNGIVFMIGALLFVVSDFIMIYYSFGKQIKPLRATNLLVYYFGQIFIALSLSSYFL